MSYEAKANIRDYVFIIALGICLAFIGISLNHNFHIREIPKELTFKEKPVEKIPRPVKKVKPIKKILPRSERNIDYKRLMKAIESKDLSSKEAMFYNTIPDEKPVEKE